MQNGSNGLPNALVVGGLTGIGLAVSRKLATKMHVVAASRRGGNGHGQDEDLESFQMDATNHDDVVRARDHMVQLGGLKALVISIGDPSRDGSVATLHAVRFRKLLENNLVAAFDVMHTMLPVLRESEGGSSIVAVSSVVGGLEAEEDQVGYSAAKAALCAVVESAAKAEAKYGVRCNSVLPGAIETDMTAKMPVAMRKATEDGIRLSHRFGKPDDPASAIAWLCSDEASYISGIRLVVDGLLSYH